MQRNTILKQIIQMLAKSQSTFKVMIKGDSMLPILCPGDSIIISTKRKYSVGDILVFYYKNDELLVHRLLKIDRGRYFCKGDNSFRIEDIDQSMIIGAVLLNRDSNNTPEFIAASYEMNILFHNCKYNIEKVKSTHEYMEYKKKYLCPLYKRENIKNREE